MIVVGGVAHLGERLNGIQEVVGSIPIISTKNKTAHACKRHVLFCFIMLTVSKIRTYFLSKIVPENNHIICSSAQLSTTRKPISSGLATRNFAMLSASNFEQSRCSGERRKLSSSAFPFSCSGIISPFFIMCDKNKLFHGIKSQFFFEKKGKVA